MTEHPIYQLRHAQLDPDLQRVLHPFIIAHRPHSPIPPRAVLKVEGEGPYFPDHGRAIDEIKEQARNLDAMYYDWLATVTRDEKGNVVDDPAD